MISRRLVLPSRQLAIPVNYREPILFKQLTLPAGTVSARCTIDPNGVIAGIGTDDRFFYSTDNGNSWTVRAAGPLFANSVISLSGDGSGTFCAHSSNAAAIFYNYGASWGSAASYFGAEGIGTYCAPIFLPKKKRWIVSSAGVSSISYADQAPTLTFITVPLGASSSSSVNNLGVKPGSEQLWLPSSVGSYCRVSDDYGETWTLRDSSNGINMAANSSIIWLDDLRGLTNSTYTVDGGNTWPVGSFRMNPVERRVNAEIPIWVSGGTILSFSDLLFPQNSPIGIGYSSGTTQLTTTQFSISKEGRIILTPPNQAWLSEPIW